MSAPWKTALVTGASSGMGRGLAIWLTKRGVKVYAAARRLEVLKDLQTEAGELISPVKLDVSDGEATFKAVAALDAECGGLDLVIANAGLGTETQPRKVDWKEIKQMIDVNVSGATATIYGALPAMIERGRGHVVGMSSLAGLQALPQSSAYCATKAYLGMFLNALRMDVEPHGVSVTSIHPGFVKTPAHDDKTEPLPFMLTLDDAVERMGRAMLRRQKVYAFPWQLSSLIGMAGALPIGVQGAVLRKMR